MANNRDYKKEWFSKAKVDYFSPFVNLWLACNCWYNFHYAELTTDRAHVDKLKTDFSRQNVLYRGFKEVFLGSPTKKRAALYANLELLHYSLNQAAIKPEKLKKMLSFTHILPDFSRKDDLTSYVDLIIPDARKKDGLLKADIEGVDLGEVVISNDSEQLFAGLIEIIYQVRCLLVHGGLEPTDENHEVVKYCYLILHDLMREFCS